MQKITFFHEHIIKKGLVSQTKLLLMLLFVSSLSIAQVPTDAVASYTFTSGSLTNVVDPGNGDLSGAAPIVRPDRFGIADNAIRANAVSRNGYQFTGTNNDVSVSFWIQGSAPISGFQRVIDIFDTSGDGLSIRTSPSNTLVTRFKNGSNDSQGAQSGLSIFDGVWHHVAFTIKKTATGYDNSVYIDGTLHASLSEDVDSSDTSNFLITNANFRVSPLNYFGNIDDIFVFNRAITSAEVNAIYTETAEVVYVNATATGANDGTSWTDAYVDLQDALANVVGAHELWVAKGTYTPDATDTSSSFVLNGSLFGGFDGTEATKEDRDMSLLHTTNATILSGDLAGDDDDTPDFNDTTRDDNSKHVVEVTNNGVEINGVIIQGGHADATSGDDRFGAGIFKSVAIANISVRNCVIKNNVAFTGAGLALTTTAQDSNMVIDACVFENNLANAAACVDYHRSGSVADMNITVTNSLFNSNRTEDDAAKGRSGSGASTLRLRAYFTSVDLHAKIVNNTFVNNVSNGSGSSSDFPVVDISRNDGGWGHITVANNIFWENSANGNPIAKAVGRSGSSTRFGNTNASRIVKNNTDEDGLSLITGTTATSSTDPNLDVDFKLTAGSTSVDTGDNSLIPAEITTDLLFNQRIFNTTVDRGAYEYDPSLGINDVVLNEYDIKLYPNPTTSILNIEMTQNLKQVSIYSVLGSEVLRTQNETIDVSGLSNGIFLIKIEDENGNVSTKRFVKK